MVFFKKIKSLKQRKLFYIYELYFKIIKLLLFSLRFHNINGKILAFKLSRLIQTKNQIHNLCIITSKSNSLSRKYKISRHEFRNLVSFGFFFGVKKASW